MAASPGTPTAGLYRVRLVRGAPWSPVKIWHGPPADPITGELLDRSPRWQAECNGSLVDIWSVWPRCAGEPIGKTEFDYLLAVRAWAVESAPHHPEAAPAEPVDFLTSPPVF